MHEFELSENNVYRNETVYLYTGRKHVTWQRLNLLFLSSTREKSIDFFYIRGNF